MKVDQAQPRWLDARTTAEYICVRPDALLRLVKQGRLPAPCYRLGPRQPRWDRLALDAWFLGESEGSDIDAAVATIVQKILAEPPKRRRYDASRAPKPE